MFSVTKWYVLCSPFLNSLVVGSICTASVTIYTRALCRLLFIYIASLPHSLKVTLTGNL
jgi:hypothetical protein